MGSLVFLKVPHPSGKLSDPWEGLYGVKEQVSPVNYKLFVPSRRNKEIVAHVTRMELWNNPDASVMRVVVAEEDATEQVGSPNRTVLAGPKLSEQQELN